MRSRLMLSLWMTPREDCITFSQNLWGFTIHFTWSSPGVLIEAIVQHNTRKTPFPLISQKKHNRFVRPFQRKSSSIKDCCLFENMENVFHYEKEKTKVKTTTGITFLRFDQMAISFLETISNSKQLSEQNSRRHE